MDLKIKDVADLLNVSETTIRRWLAEGKIPAYRINHQYRFSRGEIQNWVMSHKLSHSSHHVSLKEKEKLLEEPTQEAQFTGGIRQFSLYRSIHKGGVFYEIPGKSKEEVIRNSMSQIASDLDLDADVLTELLWDRERLQPTALNNGIGVPHTRDFLLKGSQDIVTVVFPEHPIDYGALDGKPVHTLFFLFACEDKRHLHLLAKIALLCSQAGTRDLLLKKTSREILLEHIRNWESSITRFE